MSLTHPVDLPPVEIDLSSLNARDRRKIKEANKNVKDQISLVGKNQKNATSTGDDKVYRKTLLVDDGSLEGSKSMAVAVNNAPSPIPAADNVVAATAEKEGLTSDSSLTKKKKAEELEPPLQGRPKNTRKGRAASSNLPIPEPAEAQDVNPYSGIVLKEPLGSGILPPRRPRGNTSRVRSSPSSGLVARASSQSDKEKIGNMFRCFHTRFGNNSRPLSGGSLISKRCISATLDVNGIINYYEEELAKVSKKAAVAKGEIEKLQSSSRLVQETAGLDSARQEEIERLERSGEETRKTLIETKQKLETALADHSFAKGEIELLRSELNRVKTAAEELERKNESLSELKDRDEFIAADKAWNKLNSERDEMKSILDLIKEIEDGTVNLAEEKETFVSEFADCPPLTEPNVGLSSDEKMLTGSHRAHFNEFGTNVDRLSLGRTQGFFGQDPAISSIMGDGLELRSEPPQDASSLNPKVVPTTQEAVIGGALVSSQVGYEGGSPINE
ncbi:uncharacterized protein LOC110228512 [Arabidopsis lyrata subsp. lyrata]|uniref:uncharacterized protein LOC110228512 n=1 Tax=Arabidopsis lyrata subsp. lyrata TaxID=81972 RepID=UPI000A29C38C|nr:uncharacterized protein LOC110228512 [Arabidopsis lyrata subsp. lyrata]|eukprot:XP_020881821.1 uncharacterized protein LOC110228512 [Arabidopsis lyrata subsp. lyrata]